MSGAMENRAAVFTSQPQHVEIYRDGAWVPGSLLGWRHDRDGGCQVQVRLAADGREAATWTALDYLRLPEPEPAPGPIRHLAALDAPARRRAAGDNALTGTMAALRPVPAPAARRAADEAVDEAGPSELTATMNLFAVGDDDERPGSLTTSTVSAAAGPRSGPRRRAPEVAENGGSQADGRAAVAAPAPGRHRAPAAATVAPGRHRATDTGAWPAARAGADTGERRPLPSSAGLREDDADAGLLTRPMRLDDLPGRVPQPRRPSRSGRLAAL